MAQSVKRNYTVPQQILYMVCDAAWKECANLLSAFAEFKAMYTDQYVADAVAAIKAAEDIQVITCRNAFKKLARTELVDANKLCLKNFKKLRQYMRGAYAKSILPDKLQAAGSSFYAKAAKNNWNAVGSLNSAAKDFMIDHKDELLLNNNMPLLFVSKFLDAIDACDVRLHDFRNIRVKMSRETMKKVEADNAIYEQLMGMLADAQAALADDKVNRRTFVLAFLTKIAKGSSPAKLKGWVTDENGKPLKNVSITSVDGAYKAVSDKKGFYKIGRLAAGEHTFVIVAEDGGYETMRQTITIKAGTACTVRFVMRNVDC